MNVAIDTNRHVDFARGDREMAELLEHAQQIHIS